MPYIDPKLVAEAKRMDLLTYLKLFDPSELVHIRGEYYCTRTHDSLKIDHGLWHWRSRGIGGRSAVDYLIKVRGMAFTDAVAAVLDRTAATGRVFDYQRPRVPTEERKRALLLPDRHENCDAVLAYLAQRGIDAAIAMDLARQGHIYENRYASPKNGREYANAVFVGFDMEGKPRYAMIRGIGTDYKTEASGSDKHYSFSVPAQSGADTLRLFESAIDLMSYMTLRKRGGEPPGDAHLLSLAGVYQPRANIAESKVPAAFERFCEDHPGVKRVVLHLDNDPTGRAASEALMAVLADSYSVEDAPPPKGCKDMNDYLMREARDRQADREHER